MFKDAQYHELIRKTIVAFGTLFNDLYIYRRSSTGKINQKMKVPLAYGPKQKFLARIDQDSTRGADNVKTTALTLFIKRSIKMSKMSRHRASKT